MWTPTGSRTGCSRPIRPQWNGTRRGGRSAGEGVRPGIALMPRTWLITNDFPPRPGGIQQFVHNLAIRQPADSLVVYASTWRGADTFDAEQPFEVVREQTGILVPTPAVARRAAEIARAHGCDRVWFGAAAPLG